MPSGILGSVEAVANTLVTVFTATTGKTASFSLNICNRNGTAITVRFALASTSTPAINEYFVHELYLEPNESYERNGLVMQGGYKLMALASTDGVSFNAYGYEE